MSEVDGQTDSASGGVVGTARLPRTLAGEQSGPLVIEVSFDRVTGQITGVATTLQLPQYQSLLSELIGARLEDLEATARRTFANYRGPLLRPTLAALANALANLQDAVPHARLPA